MANDRRGDTAGASPPDRELLSAADVARTIARMAHQIIEKTADAQGVVLIGETTDPFGIEAVRATMGSIFNVRLAAGTAEAFLAWRRDYRGRIVGTHLAAILANGLTVESADSTVNVRIRASDDPADLGPQDAVIVTVKAPALPAVAATIAPLLGLHTAVAFPMNGIPWWYFHAHGGRQEGRRLPRLDPGERRLELFPVDRCVDAPPSEEARVDGPAAGPEHRQGAANRCCQEAAIEKFARAQDPGDRDNGDHRSRHWGPEPGDEKERRQCDRPGDDDVQRLTAPELRANLPEHHGADNQSHQEQGDPWPTAGER